MTTTTAADITARAHTLADLLEVARHVGLPLPADVYLSSHEASPTSLAFADDADLAHWATWWHGSVESRPVADGRMHHKVIGENPWDDLTVMGERFYFYAITEQAS